MSARAPCSLVLRPCCQSASVAVRTVRQVSATGSSAFQPVAVGFSSLPRDETAEFVSREVFDRPVGKRQQKAQSEV